MIITIRVDFGTIAGIIAGLSLFGIGYNALVAWMERRGYMDGYVSFIVAGGVIGTLIPFAVINFPFVAMIAGGFVASGLPMIIGSVGRHMRQRDEARRLLAERLATYGNTASRLAK